MKNVEIKLTKPYNQKESDYVAQVDFGGKFDDEAEALDFQIRLSKLVQEFNNGLVGATRINK